MRKILLLLLLLLPVVAFCDNKSKTKLKNMPVSRWKEVKRMKPDSSIVAFTDTLFIAFRVRDSFAYNIRGGFIYQGGYTISEDSILDFGTARYRIAEKKPTSLVLTNTSGIYQFGIDSSDTVKVIVIEKEEKIMPVTNIDQMIGRWTVYKRAADGPTNVDMATQIRSVSITGPSTDGRQGFVLGGGDADNNPSWYIKSLGPDQFLDCDGKTARNIKVIKCQRGEMILEEAGIKYYFKQFK